MDRGSAGPSLRRVFPNGFGERALRICAADVSDADFYGWAAAEVDDGWARPAVHWSRLQALVQQHPAGAPFWRGFRPAMLVPPVTHDLAILDVAKLPKLKRHSAPL